MLHADAAGYLVDVVGLGGRAVQVLESAYQLAGAETMLRIVLEAVEPRDTGA